VDKVGGGSLDADVGIFGGKNFGFPGNLWCVRMNKGGLSQCGQGGVNMPSFCADVFYGRPLSKNGINKNLTNKFNYLKY